MLQEIVESSMDDQGGKEGTAKYYEKDINFMKNYCENNLRSSWREKWKTESAAKGPRGKNIKKNNEKRMILEKRKRQLTRRGRKHNVHPVRLKQEASHGGTNRATWFLKKSA